MFSESPVAKRLRQWKFIVKVNNFDWRLLGIAGNNEFKRSHGLSRGRIRRQDLGRYFLKFSQPRSKCFHHDHLPAIYTTGSRAATKLTRSTLSWSACISTTAARCHGKELPAFSGSSIREVHDDEPVPSFQPADALRAPHVPSSPSGADESWRSHSHVQHHAIL